MVPSKGESVPWVPPASGALLVIFGILGLIEASLWSLPPSSKGVFPAHVCAQSLNYAWLFVTLWTVVLQALLSMGFFRQGDWGGLPLPSPGDLPTQGSNPCLLCLLPCRGILYLLRYLEAFPVCVSMSKFLCSIRTPVFELRPILITSSLKMTLEMSVCPNKVTFWESRTSTCEFVGRGIQLDP